MGHMNKYSYYTRSGVARFEWATSYGGIGGVENNPLQNKKDILFRYQGHCN